MGDIGSKMGYNSVDNGYLSFDQYRIPRENILSRFISVDKDGSLSMNGNPKMIYQIMVKTRLSLIF